MKHDLVSQVECVQMDPSSRLDTCVNEKTAPSNVATDVVPATMSPMPKLEQESALYLVLAMKQNSRITISIFQSVFVPCVGNVRALYMLPWILAIVIDIVMLMPSLVTPPA